MEEIYDFGLRLKKLRESHNLTCSELARKAKVSKSTIMKYETQMRDPQSSVIKKLAIALETTCDYLLGMPQAAAIAIYDLSEQQQETLKALVKTINRQLNVSGPENDMDEFK